MSDRWGIVGGGMLGLTLALQLRARGHDVTVIERAESIGGLASAWRVGDVTWDRHYHVTLRSDRDLLGLLEQLGLLDEIRWTGTRTGLFADGELHSVSTPLELLRYRGLGMVDKLRIGGTLALASRIRNWRRLEAIPVATWLRRWSGNRAFERFWLPLLQSKLGDAYRDTSAAFIWATIQRLSAARGQGFGIETFGYVRGGYARILNRFEEILRERGVEILVGTKVEAVAAGGAGVSVKTASGEKHDFDRVIVTAAAPLAAEICRGLTDAEMSLLRSVRYLGIVCPSVLVRGAVSEFYVTNITDAGLPFTGIINMAALTGPFDGHTLFYLPRYLPPTDSLFDASDAAIEDEFVRGLQRVHPTIADDDVVAVRVSKVRAVMALSTLHYSDRVPSMRTSVPGLFLVNSAHIVNGTLNVNETVHLARLAAEKLG